MVTKSNLKLVEDDGEAVAIRRKIVSDLVAKTGMSKEDSRATRS